MPEGHLIHHHARAHLADLRGPLDTRSPPGRFAEEARQLDGGQIEAVEAYGKHLFYHWRDGSIVHVHLGQQGLFLHHDPPIPPPRPQVRLRIAAAGRVVDLIAPARCEAPSVARAHTASDFRVASLTRGRGRKKQAVDARTPASTHTSPDHR